MSDPNDRGDQAPRGLNRRGFLSTLGSGVLAGTAASRLAAQFADGPPVLATGAPHGGTMSTQPYIVNQDMLNALRPGDVLLSRGVGNIAELVVFFDGGKYSHAAVYGGNPEGEKRVLETSLNGKVSWQPLANEMKAQRYLDVYRWHPKAPPRTSLGDAGEKEVVRVAEQIASQGQTFDRTGAVLLALVVAITDRIKNPEDAGIVRLASTLLISWLKNNLGKGKKVMICSESVCTAYYDAVPKGEYGLHIYMGRRFSDLRGLANRLSARKAGVSPLDVTDDIGTLREQAAEVLLEASSRAQDQDQPDRRSVWSNLAQADENRSLGSDPLILKVGGPGAPLDHVTPRDLEHSPNLSFVDWLSRHRGA